MHFNQEIDQADVWDRKISFGLCVFKNCKAREGTFIDNFYGCFWKLPFVETKL